MNPELQVLSRAIDGRIAAAREEIASLESARTALVEAGLASPPSSQARRLDHNKVHTHGPLASRRQPATVRRAGTGAQGRRRRPSRTLPNEEIVALLAASPDGLSASALAKRSDVPVAKVSTQLQELEQAGTVRSTGERRTRRWHIVTDEERIATRVAELERARAKTNTPPPSAA